MRCTSYQPKIPLPRFSAWRAALSANLEKKSGAFLKIDQTPDLLRKSIIGRRRRAFFTSMGAWIYIGVIRAALSNFASASARQGASTITMQVARNFSEHGKRPSVANSARRCWLSKIEHSLTKDEILQLYINQIYLGSVPTAFGARSQVYFGKQLDQLTVAEIAMLAGLPKAPPAINPGRQHERANFASAMYCAEWRSWGT